jgi:hypothetical protein
MSNVQTYRSAIESNKIFVKRIRSDPERGERTTPVILSVAKEATRYFYPIIAIKRI